MRSSTSTPGVPEAPRSGISGRTPASHGVETDKHCTIVEVKILEDSPPRNEASDLEGVISLIAEELVLSRSTVSTYRTRILKKLTLENNAGLVRYAIKHRLME